MTFTTLSLVFAPRPTDQIIILRAQGSFYLTSESNVLSSECVLTAQWLPIIQEAVPVQAQEYKFFQVARVTDYL